jgi:hypothetical protein
MLRVKPTLQQYRTLLSPYIALTAATLFIALAIPIYNMAATGSPTQNLYTLVWAYDQVGFGECCGRSGHTPEKGLLHVRYDLSLMAADLYGWQLQDIQNIGGHLSSLWQSGELGTSITPELQEHLRTEGDTWPLTGISWILLPLGLLIGFRKRWTWLLAGAALGLIVAHLAYWIGSQRYSTRYYFEALSALALLSALPIAWLLGWIMWLARYIAPWAHHVARIVVYGAFGGLLVFSLYAYSTPRIEALYRFNFISPVQVEEVQARAEGDQRLLVVVMQGPGEDNTVRWRSYGSLMAVTGPYLDTNIVVARAYSAQDRLDLIAQFPERQVVDLLANGNDWWFAADVPALSGSPAGEPGDDVDNPGEPGG